MCQMMDWGCPSSRVEVNGALEREVARVGDATHARQEVNVDAICTLKRVRRTRWWRASRDLGT